MTSKYRCEVYLRTDTIGFFDAQKRVINRVRALERTPTNEQNLTVTWQGVETHENEHRHETRETYGEFDDWARRNGFELEPSFSVRSMYVPGSTELRECIVFPVVALAIYEQETLRAVVPCSDEIDHYTVAEVLEGFERGDIERWLARFDGIAVDRTAPRLEATMAL